MTRLQVEAERIHDTLGLMQCQALLDNVLTDDNGTDKTLGDRLGNAQAKAVTSALVTTPANVEKKTFADTMTDAADETNYTRSLSSYQSLLLKPLQYTTPIQGR